MELSEIVSVEPSVIVSVEPSVVVSVEPSIPASDSDAGRTSLKKLILLTFASWKI